jgi:ribosomal protein L15
VNCISEANRPVLNDGTLRDMNLRIKEKYLQLLRADQILIDKNDLTIGDVIGQGNFGCVFKGKLSSNENKFEEEVAVKTLDNCKFHKLYSNYAYN